MLHAPPAAASDRAFFGHPRGLATLFFTEMWERFSYYGMRALLILFMTATAAEGGLGFDVAQAGAIYGLYTSAVYMMSLPGGWLADRFLGKRRAVWYGGILIASGHYSMAVPTLASFYLGLVLIVLGTGLLKPNISAIVGDLYGPADIRRDSGFSIFYMGINLGAFIAPLLCGYLGQRVDWHMGFGLAGIGMTLGLVQYRLGARHLGEAGMHPVAPESAAAAERQRSRLRWGLIVLALVPVVLLALSISGLAEITAVRLANAFGVLLLALVVVVLGAVLFLGDWTTAERKRLIVILVLFLAASLFWSVFEQAGSTLNLFAQRSTENSLLGFPFPSSWFQSLNALFLIAFAPVFAWLWIRLGERGPSVTMKFVLGLVFAGLGFAVMMAAAELSASGVKVSPMWLTATYLLHTFGELCLSPVGLSAMTKLAPASVVSLMMGVWFLATSVGNYLGGRMAALYEALSLATLFGAVAAFAIGAGLLLALLARPISRMTGSAR
jgi:POT family proton-dependent oligopeptide transporter